MNVTAKHISPGRGGGNWRDIAVRVTGGDMAIVAASFEQAWRRRFHNLPYSPWVRVNMTRRLRAAANWDLLTRISKAEKRIWITSAYFIPRTLLAISLKAAATRGVDVRVLSPSVSDIFFVPWLTRLYSVFLCSSGVRFFEYLPAVLHAKSAIIDDWCYVGSSNFNHRSYIHDLELDLVLSRRESLDALVHAFQEDCRHSKETRGQDAHRGIIGILARLLWRLRRYG